MLCHRQRPKTSPYKLQQEVVVPAAAGWAAAAAREVETGWVVAGGWAAVAGWAGVGWED